MQTMLYGLRKERNLTQKEMGEIVGISETTDRNKESGTSVVGRRVRKKD